MQSSITVEKYLNKTLPLFFKRGVFYCFKEVIFYLYNKSKNIQKERKNRNSFHENPKLRKLQRQTCGKKD